MIPRGERARPSKRPLSRPLLAPSPRCSSASPSPSWSCPGCRHPELPSAPSRTCRRRPWFSETCLRAEIGAPTVGFTNPKLDLLPFSAHLLRPRPENWDSQRKKRHFLKVGVFPVFERKRDLCWAFGFLGGYDSCLYARLRVLGREKTADASVWGEQEQGIEPLCGLWLSFIRKEYEVKWGIKIQPLKRAEHCFFKMPGPTTWCVHEKTGMGGKFGSSSTQF